MLNDKKNTVVHKNGPDKDKLTLNELEKVTGGLEYTDLALVNDDDHTKGTPGGNDSNSGNGGIVGTWF